jgi:uncharacterized protein
MRSIRMMNYIPTYNHRLAHCWIPAVSVCLMLYIVTGCGTKEFYASKKQITLNKLDSYLFRAAANGKAKEVQEFEGETPLMYAAANGSTEVVELLLHLGADVHARSVNNQTALGRAAMFGHADTAEILLNNGGRVDEQMDQGGTPLMFAANVATAKVLLKHNANVNAQNQFGITALMGATANGKVDMVKLLIEAGADVTLRDNSGKTALQHAIERGHLDVIALLKQKGDQE